jgi:threonine aldolase
MRKINLASDNYSGVHPDIFQAMLAANHDTVPAYGSDVYTARAEKKFREHFGEDIDVFFVFNGTAANVTALTAMTHSYQAVICADTAHIYMHECGAPGKFTGAALLLVPAVHGKVTIDQIKKHLTGIGDQHMVQPAVISISQVTEHGTVYTPDEIKTIADFAHDHQLLLHMDGARISNAAASLNLDLRSVSRDAGVDVLSFGGTKNGMMFAEAVVFFNSEFFNSSLAKNFLYIRKQSMQLASKMRFISAQFEALLSNDLWRHNATHANHLATLLSDQLARIPAIKITQPAQANSVYAIIPKTLVPILQEKADFYIWNESLSEARLMTSFASTEQEINEFVTYAKQVCSGYKA